MRYCWLSITCFKWKPQTNCDWSSFLFKCQTKKNRFHCYEHAHALGWQTFINNGYPYTFWCYIHDIHTGKCLIANCFFEVCGLFGRPRRLLGIILWYFVKIQIMSQFTNLLLAMRIVIIIMRNFLIFSFRIHNSRDVFRLTWKTVTTLHNYLILFNLNFLTFTSFIFHFVFKTFLAIKNFV